MTKYILILLAALLSSCTFHSGLNYDVRSLDGQVFTDDDLMKIDEYLTTEQEKEKAGPNSYYLSKTNGFFPTDIMRLNKTETGISVSVSRLSGSKGFSRKWTKLFEDGTKAIIEKTTGKKVELIEKTSQ